MASDANDIALQHGSEGLRRAFDRAEPQSTKSRRDGRAPPTITARALQGKEFPPIRFVVPGYFAEGLTLFGGKPKIGKSWMMMGTALAVAFGGVALGSVKCEAGDVLYAALEDNERRLQRRIAQLLPHDSVWPDRLHFITEMPRLNEGGMNIIKAWCKTVANPRLVILDTFAMVRPKRSTKDKDSTYDADYAAVAPLQKLAGKLGIAIVLVHHVRKMDAEDPLDTISGTTGLTGSPDAVMVLTRDGQGSILRGRGRDLEDFETALSHDKATGQWTILGDAAEIRRSDERNAILDALAEGDALSPAEIAAAADMPDGNVRKLLHHMVKDGQVEKPKRGHYRSALGGGNKGNEVTTGSFYSSLQAFSGQGNVTQPNDRRNNGG